MNIDDLQPKSTPRVITVKEDFVTIEIDSDETEGPRLMKNEVVYVRPRAHPKERLMGEVLRVRGRQADVQVFEDTRGVGIGDTAEQTGHMLSVDLGPGLLGQVYDGLQNPLPEISSQFGFFLPRGVRINALDRVREWYFTPLTHAGQYLRAGDVIGVVQEGLFVHKIMIPFDQPGEVKVSWIQEGRFTVDVDIARLQTASGDERPMTMVQRWPVRIPLSQGLIDTRICQRLYPTAPLVTTLRMVDTFFPIALGGTACIPGPFGAGKTVLQNLISRFSQVDIVIVVACGERAGEVVETISAFPKLRDPKTQGSLMDRTVVICNTSAMPVAAREASIYTGMTIGEYYRQMGYDVLLLADSTSRWAQAMRETSGRMEEIPGEEAFPAYLDSAIRCIYERAGLIQTNDGSAGSLTIIGTVSPAGGNFEEPVTQSTLSTVKTFLGLSAERAYRRFYPAIDPLISWSRYREQLREWYDRNYGSGWCQKVNRLLNLLKRGDDILQMMQVTGEEGVSLQDYTTYQKALFVDNVFLQQDAFDEVDASVPLSRQSECLRRVLEVVEKDFMFDTKDAARDFFIRLSALFRNLNLSRTTSVDYSHYADEIMALLQSVFDDSERNDP